MTRKNKAVAVVAAPTTPTLRLPYIWVPALVFIALPLWELFASLQVHDFPRQLFWVHHELLNSLSTACWIVAAVAAVLPPFRKAVMRHLDSLATLPRAARLAWLGVAYLAFFAWTAFMKYAQYRSFQLPQDSTIAISQAYTFLHHGSLFISIFGVGQFSIHIFLLMPLFAPLLLIWRSPVPLLLAQNAFVCAAPFAVYALAESGTGSAFLGFAGLLLACSSPFLYELLTSNLCYPALVALLPWAMYFFELGWWVRGAILLVLMNIFPEQVPFIFFGLGVWLVITRARASRRDAWLGVAVCGVSVAVWAGERALIAHFARQEPFQTFAGSNYWSLFKDLVPAQTPYERILPEVTGHPLRTVIGLLSSPYRYFPMLRALFSVAFLPLMAPAALLPFLTSIAPNVLAAPVGPVNFLDYHPIGYFDFGLHQGSYMFGPLLWATALGLRQAYAKLSAKGWTSWLLVWVLFFAGFGFKYAHRTLMPDWRPRWFDSLPVVAAQVPPKARLWVEEYASPPLALRRWIKIMQWGPDEPNGYERLFVPDYVLLDKAFIFQGKPPYRDRILTFLDRHGFVKAAEQDSIVLLRNPNPSPDPEADIHDWIQLPQPDIAAASRFAKYLLNAPVSH